jgi:hypothetical protein
VLALLPPDSAPRGAHFGLEGFALERCFLVDLTWIHPGYHVNIEVTEWPCVL